MNPTTPTRPATARRPASRARRRRMALAAHRLRLGLLSALVANLLVLGALAAPVSAADIAVFGTPTAVGTFDKTVDFRQPVTLSGPIDRVELLVTFADALGPTVIDVPPPTTSGALTLAYTMPVSGEDHILPNTPLRSQWRIRSAADHAMVQTGPENVYVYSDGRFDWQTQVGPIVRVHWYDGDAAFGQRALKIGEDAIEASSKLLGVTETEPVDFYVYGDQSKFYDALGPATRENVGGQADAEIRTLFALITPSDINDPWVGIVIPHELTHLVFNTAVQNPYHFPPRWLNEGLAVYESEGYPASDKRAVAAAAKSGDLTPLTGLSGQFPTSADGFSLAYSESVSAVDYLIRAHGKDALVGLVRSYAKGLTDDEAFTAAIGVDVEGFSDAWLADNGAKVPERLGPQPAPAGPVPSDWQGSGSALPPTTSASPGSSVAVASPGASQGTGSAAPTSAPTDVTGSGSGSSGTVALLAIGFTVVVVGLVSYVAYRRRRAAL